MNNITYDVMDNLIVYKTLDLDNTNIINYFEPTDFEHLLSSSSHRPSFNYEQKLFLSYCSSGTFDQMKAFFVEKKSKLFLQNSSTNERNEIFNTCFFVCCKRLHFEAAEWIIEILPHKIIRYSPLIYERTFISHKTMFQSMLLFHSNENELLWFKKIINNDDQFKTYLAFMFVENYNILNIPTVELYLSLNPQLFESGEVKKIIVRLGLKGNLYLIQKFHELSPNLFDTIENKEEWITFICKENCFVMAKYIYDASSNTTLLNHECLGEILESAIKHDHFEMLQWVYGLDERIFGFFKEKIGIYYAEHYVMNHYTQFLWMAEKQPWILTSSTVVFEIFSLFCKKKDSQQYQQWFQLHEQQLLSYNDNDCWTHLFANACMTGCLKQAKWLLTIQSLTVINIYVGNHAIYKYICGRYQHVAEWFMQLKPFLYSKQELDTMVDSYYSSRLHYQRVTCSIDTDDEADEDADNHPLNKQLNHDFHENDYTWWIREENAKRQDTITYVMWLMNKKLSPNRQCIFFALPEELTRKVIEDYL